MKQFSDLIFSVLEFICEDNCFCTMLGVYMLCCDFTIMIHCLWYSPGYDICDTYFHYFIHTRIISLWRLKKQDSWLDWLLYVLWSVWWNKKIPNFDGIESSVFVFRTLLLCSLHILVSCPQSQFLCDFRCDFLPQEQVSCASIQAPAIW